MLCLLCLRQHALWNGPDAFSNHLSSVSPIKGLLMQIPGISFTRSLLVAGLLAGTACFAADTKPLVIHEYAAEGHDCFAVAIKPHIANPNQIKRHVILVDTSASQAGVVRESTLQLVSGVLAKLSPSSMVQVYAVDVECTPLTDGFVPTASKDVNDAINQLTLRTPLGTTNLRNALQTVANSTTGKAPTSVLIIGDGISASDRISSEELNAVVTNLNNKMISVHSIVLGPKANEQLPSVLANLTGGTVTLAVVGNEAIDSAAVAKAMPVAPTAVSGLQADGASIDLTGRSKFYVRADRHSVVFGSGKLSEFKTLSAIAADGQTLSWSADESTRTQAGPEITHLQSRIANSSGMNAEIASLEQLQEATRQFNSAYTNTVAAAKFLQRSGREKEARQALARANEMNPQTILTNFQDESAVGTLPQPPAEADPNPFDANPFEANPFETAPGADEAIPAPAATTPLQGGLDSFDGAPVIDDPLSEVEAMVKVQTAILAQETNRAIDDAREAAFENPDAAASILKQSLETIRSSADISPDTRAELERRVIAALAAVQNQRQFNTLRSRQIAKEEAIQDAQRKRLSEQDIEDQRLAILIDQVRGLLQRARHGDEDGYEDAEGVSRTALNLIPGNGPATQALVMSEASGQLGKAYRLVNLRHDRFLETLYQVELSHVPFPDEPPIQFPPAEVWRRLSLTRVPKYKSFDLRSEKPVEKWLSQMLDKPVDLDFPGETPLSEILEYIATDFSAKWGLDPASGSEFFMTILPDYAELQLANVTWPDEPLIQDVNFKGMTLRNALEHMFSQTDPALTYIIDKEVLLITSVEKEQQTLVTRVYPVADLAIPPVQLGGGGGLGGGQGGGQGGGFGGGQGGGGFGGGQGGGGQGGFGGGGGAGFSVPPEVFGALGNMKGGISTDDVNSVKKKPQQK